MPFPSVPSRFSLFLDVDGTLIDLAPRPDAVVVPPDLKRTLMALDDQLRGAVALVSGRTIADLDHLFHPLRLRSSGVHGAEMRFDPRGAVESGATILPESTVAALHAIVDAHPGTLIEDKRHSVAIHYRAVPHLGPTLGVLLQGLMAAEHTTDLRILPGHMVYEVKRAGFDKGVAIQRFLAGEPFLGRTPVFLGDDVTDEPGFAVVAALGGFALAVGQARQGASACVAGPADVRAWLARLAEASASP